MSRYDVLLFDVDGTLVDATSDIANSMNHALKVLNLPPLPKKRIVAYIGTGVTDLISKSLGSTDKKLVEKATKLYSDHYIAHAINETVLYPHVTELLECLKDRRKFILTNRYASFADVALRGLGIRDHFEEIVGGDDANCLKPMGCVIDRMAEKFGFDKSRSLMVGDMDIDVMTAKNASVASCWVTYGLGKKKDVAPLKPEYIIDDILELKKIVK